MRVRLVAATAFDEDRISRELEVFEWCPPDSAVVRSDPTRADRLRHSPITCPIHSSKRTIERAGAFHRSGVFLAIPNTSGE